MPNTQTSVPAFTAGQVLTAQQMTEVNTGIPVFATTTTRDAAFGGTGEKTLSEGQFAYIEATNTTQYYDGAAWQPVGVSGLTLISATTIGSAVASVTVSNAFSSTYDNYKIILSGGVGSANGEFTMQLGATTTGYYEFYVYGSYTATTVSGQNVNNGSAWNVGYVSTNGLNLNCDIFAPNLAKNTQIAAVDGRALTTGNAVFRAGNLSNTTQYTAFTLTPDSGTLTGGVIRVYGYQNS